LARFGVGRLEVDVDHVAFVDGDLALAGGELVDGDVTFGLVADVDRDGRGTDGHHATGDDVTGLRTAKALLEERSKVVFAAGIVVRSMRHFGHQEGTPHGRDSDGERGNPHSIPPSVSVFKGEEQGFRGLTAAGPHSDRRARATRSISAITCSNAMALVSSS